MKKNTEKKLKTDNAVVDAIKLILLI